MKNSNCSPSSLDCSRDERGGLLLVAAVILLAACATTPPPAAPPDDVLENAKLPPRKKVATTLPPPMATVPVATRPFAPVEPLTLVLQPVKDKPIVALRVVFHSGAVDDPSGKEGLTALTTAVLTEGGTAELSSAQLIEALYPMAAELDGHSDKEFTVFEGRVHIDKLDRFLQIFTDVLLHPRFDPKEFDRLRTAALNTVKNRLRQENDEELGKVGLDALLYAGHPYRHFNGGTVAGLTSLTLDDVKAQWQRVFSQDRAVLGLAGAVDEKLAAKVKDLMAKLPAKGAPMIPIPPAPGFRSKTTILQRDTLSAAGSFGYSWSPSGERIVFSAGTTHNDVYTMLADGSDVRQLTDDPADEEAIRRTLKIINDKIIEFKTQFAGKDMQDYIAMVMIWYATQTSAETNPALEKEMTDVLLKIEQQLDKVK